MKDIVGRLHAIMADRVIIKHTGRRVVVLMSAQRDGEFDARLFDGVDPRRGLMKTTHGFG